jgi:hypothetical protein
MLGVGDATTVNRAAWQELPVRTRLPWPWRKFVTDVGLGRAWPQTRRQYERAPLRVQVILSMGGVDYAGYAKDISRLGVGFYSPIHLLPKQAVEMRLLNGKTMTLRIARCRRIGPQCFECGSLFDLASKKPAPRVV